MGMSLFQTQQSNKGGFRNADVVSEVKKLINNKDSGAVVRLMCQRNPQFAQFVNECKGMNINQICEKYNLDYNAVCDILKGR